MGISAEYMAKSRSRIQLRPIFGYLLHISRRLRHKSGRLLPIFQNLRHLLEINWESLGFE